MAEERRCGAASSAALAVSAELFHELPLAPQPDGEPPPPHVGGARLPISVMLLVGMALCADDAAAAAEAELEALAGFGILDPSGLYMRGRVNTNSLHYLDHRGLRRVHSRDCKYYSQLQ